MGRDALDKGCGKDAQLLCPLPANLHVFTNPGALWTLPFWGLMEGSLHTHNGHCQLIQPVGTPSPMQSLSVC